MALLAPVTRRAAAVAQANVSPEPPTKERELQAQLLVKENDMRRMHDRLVSMCEQVAECGRLQSELQQEKERVQELQSEMLELQRQLQQQKNEAHAQNLQVLSLVVNYMKCSGSLWRRGRLAIACRCVDLRCLQASARMIELQSQLQALKQRCDVCDRDNLEKVAEAAAARTQCSENEGRMNALRRQLENSQLQLQVAQTNESDMKKQLDAEKKLHLLDAQAAEEMKQFTRKVYGVLKEGAMMLDKVPSSLGAACPPMKFDSSSASASRDGSYSQ